MHLHFEIVACVVQPDGTVRVGNAPVREALVRLAAGFDAANAKARERLRKREAKAVKAAERAKAAGRKPRKRQRWIDHGPDAMHVDYREQMRLLHDLYADRFADFGIVRGASDAKRRYREPIDQDKADAARERSLEREATAARAALRDELERERRDVADELAQARAQRDEARADRDEADRRDGIPGILQAFTVAADRLGAALPEPLSAAILQCAEHRSTRPIYALLAALRAGAPAAAKVRGEGRER